MEEQEGHLGGGGAEERHRDFVSTATLWKQTETHYIFICKYEGMIILNWIMERRLFKDAKLFKTGPVWKDSWKRSSFKYFHALKETWNTSIKAWWKSHICGACLSVTHSHTVLSGSERSQWFYLAVNIFKTVTVTFFDRFDRCFGQYNKRMLGDDAFDCFYCRQKLQQVKWDVLNDFRAD